MVRRDGRQHAKFSILDRDGVRHQIDASVVRWVVVRRAGAADQRRPVVALRLCVAGVRGAAEFTLADRGGLDYPVLVGRAFLAGKLVVDSAAVNTADGSCSVRKD